MFRDVSLVFRTRQEPFPRTLSVCDRFLCSERLASDDEECSLRVTFPDSLGDMCAVDVGYKIRLQIAFGVVFQSFGHHDWAQIGSTDSDVDDGIDRLPRVSFPLPAPHGL